MAGYGYILTRSSYLKTILKCEFEMLNLKMKSDQLDELKANIVVEIFVLSQENFT